MPRTPKSQAATLAGPRLVRKSVRAPSTRTGEALHEQIAIRAYELFLQEGCKHGRDVSHWLRAEQELHASETPAPAVKKVGGPRKKS